MKSRGYEPDKTVVVKHANGRPMMLLICVHCGCPPNPYGCQSGVSPTCHTYETQIYSFATAGMKDNEIAESLFINPKTMREWKDKAALAQSKQFSGSKLTDEEAVYLRFGKGMARRQRQLQTKLHQILVARANADKIENRDLIATLKYLNENSWDRSQHDALSGMSLAQLLAPTMAEAVRALLDGLGLTDEQRAMVPELIQSVFSKFESSTVEGEVVPR